MPYLAKDYCNCHSLKVDGTLAGVVTSDDVLTYRAPGPIYNISGNILVLKGVALIVEPG